MSNGSNNKLSNAQYRILRNNAEKLRRRGLSYKEIQKTIKVSKSTLSLWCRNIPLTKKQIKRLGSLYDTQMRGAKANQYKSKARKKEVREEAKKEISNNDLDILKIAGAMLYWAEGSKTHNTAIANSDPAFIVFYIKWLKKVLNIKPNQLNAHLHLHEGQNDKKEKEFWSKITGIPLKNFGKTYLKPKGIGHRKNILYHGTIRIRVIGKGAYLLREKIFGWIEGFIEYYVSKKIIEDHYKKRMGR